MKKILLLSIMTLLATTVMAQGNFTVIQQRQAHYPGGDTAFQNYFNRNLKYNSEAFEKRLYGSVMVSFNVMPDSTLNDVTVLSGVGCGVDEEVEALIKPMKFVPALANGVLVRSNVIVSVTVKAIPRTVTPIEKP